MMTMTASQARTKLNALLDKAATSRAPIRIIGQRSNGVLLAHDDWRAIQETLYLISIPGMRASIRRGLRTPVRKCATVTAISWSVVR